MGDAGAVRGAPTVSVVIPVWNVEPWLDQCLASVEDQTLGTDRLELIAVDDGSTDRSAEQLDAFALGRDWVQVVHQANSGGPGGPRNTGLDRASGEYVFFLDGDDYLGEEALERLVVMADRNRSDIVLGRIVGLDGRINSGRVGKFRENQDRVAPEVVYRSGNVQKLFRRSMLERAGLRFQPGLAAGEDAAFMASAYLEAGTISIVADYACYYLRKREGSQTTNAERHGDLVEYFGRLEATGLEVAAAKAEPGPQRDRLLSKPLLKLTIVFWQAWRGQPDEERRRTFEAGSAVVRRWHSPGVDRWLPHRARLVAHCLRLGRQDALADIVATPRPDAYRDPTVDGKRIYARYPHFRDAVGIPDACFEITREIPHRASMQRAGVVDGQLELEGEAYIRLLGGETLVELRRWPFGHTVTMPTTAVATPLLADRGAAYPVAGFHASLPVAELGVGRWSVHVVTRTGAVRRERPLRAERQSISGGTRGHGRVALHLGPRRGLRVLVGGVPRSRAGRRLGDLAERGLTVMTGLAARMRRRARSVLPPRSRSAKADRTA